MKMSAQQSKILGHSKSSPAREVHSITGLPQETRKIAKKVTLQLKDLEREQEKPRVSRRKEK